MEGFEIVKRTQIDGDLEGLDEEGLLKLKDGTCWVQDEHEMHLYHYVNCHQAKILRKDDRLYIQVDGEDEIVPVHEASAVTRSKIKGDFNGWSGKSTYELTNGEVWQQASAKYKYKYVYMPTVIIYETPSGMVMEVAGTRAKVKRVK
jgi:hypothetical protein